MRRAFLLLLACGCASAGTPSGETIAKRPTILVDPQAGMIMGEQPRGESATIAAPPMAVWAAAKKVYANLGVRLTIENPATHQLGNPNFYAIRQFAGQPMTKLVDCGNGMTGAKAASYRIYMSLVTTIETDGGSGSRVNTIFVPMGQDVSEGSTDRITCGSKGALEQIVLDQITAAAAKP